MANTSQSWLFLLIVTTTLLAAAVLTTGRSLQDSIGINGRRPGIKSGVFYTPPFTMTPGSVALKYYYNSDFPRGHIALKSFRVELVDDEHGTVVPYSQLYLHHALIYKYHQRNDVTIPDLIESEDFPEVDGLVLVRNNGPCTNENVHTTYLGLGSELRGTTVTAPGPYGIEFGNPALIPKGYDERFLVVIHAIDTRGTADRYGCAECKRELYNATLDQHGQPLKAEYRGGVDCCYAHTQCKLKEEHSPLIPKTYRMRYLLEWTEWDSSIIPVRVHITDITTQMRKFVDSKGLLRTETNCQVEFKIEECNKVIKDDCVDVRRTNITMPKGGNIIFGMSHMHEGGIQATLYGEDGRVLCAVRSLYGQGGDEGYVVESTTCGLNHGSAWIKDGETLTHETVYHADRPRTGLMGNFYLLVADQAPAESSAPFLKYSST